MQPTGLSSRFSGSVETRRYGLDEDGVHQVRLFRGPYWCPSGGINGGTGEAGGTVAESLIGQSSALSGECAPDSARGEA